MLTFGRRRPTGPLGHGRERKEPLRAAGTTISNTIEPCHAGPKPRQPEPSDPLPGLALAFSGGGWRATLAAAGVVRFIADAGLLGRVTHVSSVSGGSVANAMLAGAYGELASEGFDPERVDQRVILPLVEKISTRSLTFALIRQALKLIGPKTRTDLLADELDRWFLERRGLHEIAPGPRWIFNAANLTTGVRFAFERELIGDYVMGHAATEGSGLRLAEAVAASCAVPGAFAAFRIGGERFPCAAGSRALLLDGGVYDNLGLEAIERLDDNCLVGLSAGGVFRTRAYGALPIIRDLKRTEEMLYRESTSVRSAVMVERFRAFEQAREHGLPAPPFARQGVLFGLATTLQPSPEWAEAHPEFPSRWAEGEQAIGALRATLALTKTTFGRLARERCEQLVYRGWWLAGASLSRFQRPLLGDVLPAWRPL